MEASTCVEIKRYVANNIGIGIIHNICIDPDDTSRFRSSSVEKLFPHPETKLIFRRTKTLSMGEKNLSSFSNPLLSLRLRGGRLDRWDAGINGDLRIQLDVFSAALQPQIFNFLDKAFRCTLRLPCGR